MHTVIVHTFVHAPDPTVPDAYTVADVCASAALAPNPFYHLSRYHPDATDCEAPFRIERFQVLHAGADITDDIMDFDQIRILDELQQAYRDRVTVLQ